MAIINFPPTAGEPTDGSFTYTFDGVIYSWTGSYWSANSQSGFNNHYVEVAGDNMTGNLTLGTDKITLNAADGSITAVGNGQFGDPYNASDSDRIGVVNSVGSNSAIVSVFHRPTASPASAAFSIKRDNIETFRAQGNGNLQIGGTIPSAPNITLSADGSVSLADGNFTLASSGVSTHQINNITSKCINTAATIGGESIHITKWEDQTGTIASQVNGSGDLWLGGNIVNQQPNIRLTGTAGSAEFAGTLDCGSSARFLSGINGSDGNPLNAWITSTVVAGDPQPTLNLFDYDQKHQVTLRADGLLRLGGTLPSNPNIKLDGSDGSARFLGTVNAGQGNAYLGGADGVQVHQAGYVATSRTNPAANIFLVYTTGNVTPTIAFRADGAASFAGTVTADNVTFNLEADDDTKYTATTDAEGNETRVYNGATLDVKDRLTKADTALQSLKSAAAAATDFASLQSAIATALANI